SVYYLQTARQPNPTAIPDRKKRWIEMAEEKSDEVARFIKENRLKLHRNEDLIRLVDYLNTI
ncbi:MAG: hypothetical protein U9N86_17470, partial [Bacteroidota bacterium]|nr:hypothetical protein [Bacteroidota bacterium]